MNTAVMMLDGLRSAVRCVQRLVMNQVSPGMICRGIVMRSGESKPRAVWHRAQSRELPSAASGFRSVCQDSALLACRVDGIRTVELTSEGNLEGNLDSRINVGGESG